ncbi:DUF1758 domain-containing protein [Trichonephila clavipes]|nr:DUF1758 domain-containing protein [Trichonephila clavipes]
MVSGERSPGIEESDVFKEDYEFVKTVIEQLLEETKTQESEHNSQLELERLKLERVKAELELAQLGNNASKSETSFNKCETETSIDVFIKSDSVFGYIVGGSVEDEPNLYSCGLICGSEELNSNLRKFWEIEEIDNELPKNLENSICEEHYAQTHKRDESGKYIVSIPFKEHWSCLGNSKDIALKRLESLWTRLSRDQDYQKLFRDFLKEYEELGHMTEITESVEPEYTYYMPHHGIYRPQKSTTKLRTVFNASALTANGRSLNSIQYNGGVIQDDLFPC